VAHSPGASHFSELLHFEVEDPEPEIVLQRMAETLTSETERFSSFSKLYLTGELAASRLDGYVAKLPDAELLSKGLGIRQKAVATSVMTNLATAIGLAISGLGRRSGANLIPADKRVISTHASLVATYVLGVLLLLSLGALVTRGFLQQSVLADQVDSVISDLKPEVEQIFRIREQAEKKKNELTELRSLMGERQETLLVLRDLTERIPDDTYLQNLQVQGDQLTMQGYSVQASALLSVLSESPYLESVKTNWITQDPRVSGKERFNFTAKIK
jgi:general secretion pathway protein L